MTKIEVYSILGIDEGSDREAIVTAYREKVVKVNPEDDQEGFMRLREAYELAIANLENQEKKAGDGDGEEASESNELVEEKRLIPLNLYDGYTFADDSYIDGLVKEHIKKLIYIYSDFDRRLDIKEWEAWFADPVCIELDSVDAMREATLVFFMSFYRVQKEVFELLVKNFDVENSIGELTEKFPPDYLNFLVDSAKNTDSLDLRDYVERSSLEGPLANEIENIDFKSEKNVLEWPEYYLIDDLYIRLSQEMTGKIQEYMYELATYQNLLKEEDEDDEDPKKAEEKAKNLQNCLENKENIKNTILNFLENRSKFRLTSSYEIALMLFILEVLEEQDKAYKLAYAVLVDEKIKSNYFTKAAAIKSLIHGLKLKKDSESYDQAEYDLVYDKCQKVLEELEAEHPDYFAIKKARMVMQIFDENWKDADETAADILRINSYEWEAVYIEDIISKNLRSGYLDKIKGSEANLDDILEYAWLRLREDDFDEAIALVDGLNLDEKHLYPYYNILGRCYLGKKEYEKAASCFEKTSVLMDEKIEHFEELEKRDLDRVSCAYLPFYLYAIAKRNLKEYDEALTWFDKAIERTKIEKIAEESLRKKDCNTILLEKGKLLFDMKQFREAYDTFTPLVDTYELGMIARASRIEAAYELFDTNAVMDDYYALISQYPNFAIPYYIVGRMFIEMSNFEELKEIVKKAREAEITNDLIDVLEAALLRNDEKYDQALEIYDKLLLASKDWDERYDHFRDEIFSDAARAYLTLSKREGDREKAKQCIENTLSRDKKHWRMLWNASIYGEKYEDDSEETIKAEEAFKTLIETYPNAASVYFEYSKYLLRKHKDTSIEKRFDLLCETLKADNEHLYANYYLMKIMMDVYSHGYEYSKRPYYEKAIEYATRQIEIDDVAYYYIERAWVYFAGADTKLALEDINKAIELEEDNIYAYNCKGEICLDLKLYDEAIAALKKGVELYKEETTTSPFKNLIKAYLMSWNANGKRKPEVLDEALNLANRLQQIEDTRRVDDLIYDIEHKRQNFEYCIAHRQKIYERDLEAFKKDSSVKLLSFAFNSCVKVAGVAAESGNEALAKKYEKTALDMLNNHKLLPNFFNKVSFIDKLKSSRNSNDLFYIGRMYNNLAEYCLYELRDYSKATYYYNFFYAIKDWKNKNVCDDNIHELRHYALALAYEGKKDESELIANQVLSICEHYGTGLTDDEKRILEKSGKAVLPYNYSTRFCQDQINQWPESLRKYANYLLGTTSESLSRVNVGACLALTNRMDEMKQVLGPASECVPCNFCKCHTCFDILLVYADMAMIAGDFRKALGFYETCYDIAPDDPEMIMAIRYIKKKLGEK